MWPRNNFSFPHNVKQTRDGNTGGGKKGSETFITDLWNKVSKIYLLYIYLWVQETEDFLDIWYLKIVFSPLETKPNQPVGVSDVLNKASSFILSNCFDSLQKYI